MSNDTNIISKGEMHEEVQAKQQAVNTDRAPKRQQSKTGVELLTPLYLNIIIIVNDYSDFWQVDK